MPESISGLPADLWVMSLTKIGISIIYKGWQLLADGVLAPSQLQKPHLSEARESELRQNQADSGLGTKPEQPTFPRQSCQNCANVSSRGSPQAWFPPAENR